MIDDALRRRLETLNREPVPTSSGIRIAKPVAIKEAVRPIPATAPKPGRLPALSGLLRRGDVVVTEGGEHLRIRLSIEDIWPGGQRLAIERIEHLRRLATVAIAAIEPTVVMEPDFASLVAALPDRMLLLDLETCGLAGSAVFLIGLLRFVDGVPIVELLLARNYAEEGAIFESLWEIVAECDVLVTFNGKSFDWPMVLDRSIRHRLAGRRKNGGPLHVDLLHHARRRWRRQLPDCRLQTLERLVCRRCRTDDIPGHRIPAAYSEFVRTGFERDMDAILYHNSADLVTLFDLALRLAD
jgi:uncharacterized protein YprB with RNaseH-like and TPR domain